MTLGSRHSAAFGTQLDGVLRVGSGDVELGFKAGGVNGKALGTARQRKGKVLIAGEVQLRVVAGEVQHVVVSSKSISLFFQQADGADVERGGSFHRSRDIGNSLIITYKVQIQNGVPGGHRDAVIRRSTRLKGHGVVVLSIGQNNLARIRDEEVREIHLCGVNRESNVASGHTQYLKPLHRVQAGIGSGERSIIREYQRVGAFTAVDGGVLVQLGKFQLQDVVAGAEVNGGPLYQSRAKGHFIIAFAGGNGDGMGSGVSQHKGVVARTGGDVEGRIVQRAESKVALGGAAVDAFQLGDIGQTVNDQIGFAGHGHGFQRGGRAAKSHTVDSGAVAGQVKSFGSRIHQGHAGRGNPVLAHLAGVFKRHVQRVVFGGIDDGDGTVLIQILHGNIGDAVTGQRHIRANAIKSHVGQGGVGRQGGNGPGLEAGLFKSFPSGNVVGSTTRKGFQLLDVLDGLQSLVDVIHAIKFQRIHAFAAVDAVAGGKGALAVLSGADDHIGTVRAHDGVKVRRQHIGVSGDFSRHFLVVGHGEGDALGDFAFSLSAVGHVVFQHGHARVGNGLLHGLRGPFGTIGLLFAGGDESCGLGVKVGVGVKGVGGVHAFVGTVLDIVGPRVHAVFGDDRLDVGDVELRHSGGFHAVELRGLGGVVLAGVEIGVGGHVFIRAKLNEMFVRAVFAEKTVLGKGIDEFARSPVAGRIGLLHLSQFGAHIEFVVKPGGISHCVYPPEDNKKL